MGILSMFPGGLAKTSGQYAWAKFAEKPELPVGFTKLDYIESGGAQAVDTGITPTVNTRIKMTAKRDGSGYVFGSENAWLNSAFGINIESGTPYACYGTQQAGITMAAGTEYDIDWNGTSLSMNGAVVKTFSAATINNTNPIYLFAVNRAGAVAEGGTNRIYSGVEIYQDGTNLSGKFVCCLDADGMPCMYNTVTGEVCRNVGSGVLTAGNSLGKVKADAYVISDNETTYPADGVHTDGCYYKRLDDNVPWYVTGSYVWSKSDANGNLIEYVVSDDINEFPQDGQGADGYYYKKSTVINGMKYATGSQSWIMSEKKHVIVSGLEFKPQAIYFTASYENSYYWGCAMFNGDDIVASHAQGSGSNCSVTASVTDDGFDLYFTHPKLYNTTIYVTWHALGY